MINHFRALATALIAVALLTAGCGSSDDTATAAAADAASSSDAAWLSTAITDIDGATFMISDLVGTPVLVENFATWCTQCREQLKKTQQAAAEAGDAAVFIALSVETNLEPADVADYAEDHGFDDIRFAIMTPEMLAAMQDAYGTSSLNPPSTPKIAIDATGEPGEMVTGPERPDEILRSLRPT